MTTKKKTLWRIKEDIYRWLTRLGVHEGDITIKSCVENKHKATVLYSHKGQEYVLSTTAEKGYSENLHNIEKLIHSRVLGIKRGIETLEQAFAGYKSLPDYVNNAPDYFGDCASKEDAKILFKKLAKKLHPDTGGSKEEFAELQRQYGLVTE